MRPKRFDRFPVMGAALCFDNMKNTNTEPLKLLKPEMETGAGTAGQRRVGTWICLGEGGRDVGKRTGFSHLEPALTRLFPHVATQVVDFPHKATVSQAELGTNMGKPKRTTQIQRRRAKRRKETGWTMIIDIMDGMEQRGRSDTFAFWWRFSKRSVRLCSPMFA